MDISNPQIMFCFLVCFLLILSSGYWSTVVAKEMQTDSSKPIDKLIFAIFQFAVQCISAAIIVYLIWKQSR